MLNSKSETKKRLFFTPLGWAGVSASGRGIVRIVLPKKSKKAVERELESSEYQARSSGSSSSEFGVRSSERKAEQLLSRTVVLLQKYFSGASVRLDVQVDLGSYTAFQQAVWQATARIPFNETRSYAWIANTIGNPKASRAVGQAMGANPVPILIP